MKIVKNPILLSFRQLTYFGVHIGHDKTNYMFLSSWIFLGWYKNIFIINLYKTYLSFRYAINLFSLVSNKQRPLVFVCIRSAFGPLVARYAFTCGESFNIYWWIFGTLTNFYRILGWNFLLVRLMLRNRHKLRFKDKKRLASYFGFVLHRRRFPGAGFITSVLDNLGPVDEFMAASVPCVGIVDSNVPSWNILLPVPGNDDSAICVNFYCYILARAVLAGKLKRVMKWELKVRKRRKFLIDWYNYTFRREYAKSPFLRQKYRNTTEFIFLYSNIFRDYDKKNFFRMFDEVRNTIVGYRGSIGFYINQWLGESEIVKKFSYARGESFTSISEIKPKENVKMYFNLD